MRITSLHKLLLICLGALILRLILLQFVQFPGIADPNHYYNLALRLLEGHGFTIDYIWQYTVPPQSIAHPEEHWMPFTAVLAAIPMLLFGTDVRVALLPFILIASLLPILSYWGARQLDLSESAALFSAAALAVLPEFMLYSLRTDTVIPCAFFTCLSLLLLTHGIRHGGTFAFIGSGVMAGLAYLTRNDGILLMPTLVVTLLVYARWRKYVPEFHWRGAILVPVVALIVVAPWLMRNLQTIGTLGSPETRSMFFFTNHSDHYAFGRHFTLETMLAAQTPAEIVSKRLFEMAAAVKVMIESFDVVLPVAIIGGLLLLLMRRDRPRLLAIAPALILVFGVFIAYTVFIPYKAQAGSFKKAYMSLVPLLLPLGAYALERAISDRRIRLGTMGLIVALAGVNATDMLRLDAQAASNYLRLIETMAAHTRTLPDTNGDGEIILMAEDPFIIRFAGIRSIMFPNENRDTIIDVAERYGVDYLLMPPNRPALDGLLTGEAVDPRFVFVADAPGTHYSFYAIEDAGGE